MNGQLSRPRYLALSFPMACNAMVIMLARHTRAGPLVRTVTVWFVMMDGCNAGFVGVLLLVWAFVP